MLIFAGGVTAACYLKLPEMDVDTCDVWIPLVDLETRQHNATSHTKHVGTASIAGCTRVETANRDRLQKGDGQAVPDIWTQARQQACRDLMHEDGMK